MDDFNPDVYLADKTASDPSGGFNPDQYISEKSPPYSPVDKDEPGLQDVSIPDAMMVQGLGGLAKAGAGLATRGIGAGLEALPLTRNLSTTVGDTADDMLLRSMGTSAGQVRQMGGIEAARDAAQVARKSGLDNVFTTDIGRQNALKDTIASEGQKIGSLRSQAGQASPGMLDKVREELMAKYAPTTNGATLTSNEAPDIEKALNTVRQTAGSNPSNAGIAQGVTNVNKYATGAKMLQPVNGMTDVANTLSKANNAEIAQSLGSDKAKEYLDALHNETGAFHVQPMLQRGFSREATQRLGGPSGLIKTAAQKVMDMGGYRGASQGLNALHEGLTSAPDLSNLGPSALKAYLADEAEKTNQ